jgi:UDP-N-acetylmuramate dehydrogenase
MRLPPSLIRDLCGVVGARVEVDAPLAPLTTIRTGGHAGALVTVDDRAAAVAALRVLQHHETAFYCLGAGSDLLVADEGYPGVVLRLGGGFHQVEGPAGERADKGVLTAGGAVLVARLATQAAEGGLAGLEFACGIPGCVGGGVATNAGAYGRAFSDVLTEVQLAAADGAEWVTTHSLGWEYRHCRLPEGTLVTGARLSLDRDVPAEILERYRSILEMRRSVQPQGVLTFGSTFKNPSGGAAGRLLEAAGLKGERRGGAEVSRVHANFVVNLGDASTTDVLSLMDHMRHRVQDTTGLALEPEVRLLGATFPWESSAAGSRLLTPADG